MERASSSSHEAKGDRELSSAGVRTRGRRPRILTARDNFQSRSPSAKCCELYASLHDRFRLEVRISTLRYECDETFSDECEFAERAEGEWCNHTCQENVFSHEYRTKFYITRCENADFRTRSVRKTAFTHSEWYKNALRTFPNFFSKMYHERLIWIHLLQLQ